MYVPIPELMHIAVQGWLEGYIPLVPVVVKVFNLESDVNECTRCFVMQ